MFKTDLAETFDRAVQATLYEEDDLQLLPCTQSLQGTQTTIRNLMSIERKTRYDCCTENIKVHFKKSNRKWNTSNMNIKQMQHQIHDEV